MMKIYLHRSDYLFHSFNCTPFFKQRNKNRVIFLPNYINTDIFFLQENIDKCFKINIYLDIFFYLLYNTMESIGEKIG